MASDSKQRLVHVSIADGSGPSHTFDVRIPSGVSTEEVVLALCKLKRLADAHPDGAIVPYPDVDSHACIHPGCTGVAKSVCLCPMHCKTCPYGHRWHRHGDRWHRHGDRGVLGPSRHWRGGSAFDCLLCRIEDLMQMV